MSATSEQIVVAKEFSFKELHDAVMKKDTRKLLEMVLEGAGVDVVDNYGNSLMHYAASDGLCNSVIALVWHGVDVNVKNIKGETPLLYAAQNGHHSIVEYLIKNGATFDAEDAKIAGLIERSLLEGKREEERLLKEREQLLTERRQLLKEKKELSEKMEQIESKRKRIHRKVDEIEDKLSTGFSYSGNGLGTPCAQFRAASPHDSIPRVTNAPSLKS